VSRSDPDLRRRFAELIGKGATVREAAAAIGRSERTGFVWMRDAAVQEIARQAREAALDPTALTVVKEALAATLRDGRPDFATRLKAAQLLLRNPEIKNVDPATAGRPIIHIHES